MSINYVTGQTYRNDRILLNDSHFIDCEFFNCTFVYGGGDWSFEKCRLVGQCGVDLSNAGAGGLVASINTAGGRVTYAENPTKVTT